MSGKRKAELVELCWNSYPTKSAQDLKEEAVESTESLIKEQLKTADEGFLANPSSKESGLPRWTHNFVSVPEFRFPDLFNYLVGRNEYNPENLKLYKSLLGYKLYFDGHVEDLRYHPPQPESSSYCTFKFSVNPTEKSKADDGSATYRFIFYLL